MAGLSTFGGFPVQTLSYKSKGEKWRKSNLDWADGKSFFFNDRCRDNFFHDKINYDLINGIIHIEDIERVLNPDRVKTDSHPDNIQHYPIINSKVHVLLGEEWKRLFDYKVIITNPNSVTEIEEKKKEEVYKAVMQAIEESNAGLMQQIQIEQQMQQAQQAEQAQAEGQEEAQLQPQPQQQPQQPSEAEQEYQKKIERIAKYYTYDYQDLREIRANALLHHYYKEQNFPLTFNKGFLDGLTCAKEIYWCHIVSGEPIMEKLDPQHLTIFRSGDSNKIEDADVIIKEDYWSLGKIYDNYYDKLTDKDRKYLESHVTSAFGGAEVDDMGNEYDSPNGLMLRPLVNEITVEDDFYFNPFKADEYGIRAMSPFDGEGNIRVLQMFWKSRRKIKKVTSYDPQTGEEVINYYDETYIIDEAKGEKEETFWINQAWQGTKIGKEVYVDIKPCPVQYNRMTNPSLCHFGIIGSIYAVNGNKPFSMVDMMKPYAYLYDVVHARMEKLIARDWGFLLNYDLAKHPRGWDMQKVLYFAKNMGILVQDSFNEGNIGASTGKLAAALNNNATGGFNASQAEAVQGYANTLEWISNKIGEIVGISKQREGQISNRETVGGVERSTLQSSYITEQYFAIHDDIKRRVMECFLETAKIAMKGKNKKFQYITDDFASKFIDIDGDEFAENDYGLVVDSSETSQKLNQNLEMLAQAALQNQVIDFSTIMKLYGGSSLAEKQRLVEQSEREKLQQAQEAQQQQLQIQQEQIKAQQEMAQQQMQQQYMMNQENNQTKITVAEIAANSKLQTTQLQLDNADDGSNQLYMQQQQLDEQRRQFDIKARQADQKLKDTKQAQDANLRLSRDKLNQDKELTEKKISVQRMAKKQPSTSK